ncbi:methylphosphonate synthase [Streptomyces griseochromogenes]|uniref:Methylphosphonate synthase n=1 Tax=Streptomyces griseochromogenes TaxID=68214 RepID=A0A1B1APY1_9ACTN|nr:helix-turn-helix transcriptional regulator [Streptomyces griseochromogenes]ANP48595.1 transcriptional regulator [Streptomyces griseochromogenes]MBP2054496.1 methylphosphonate synthase [Streptomyces griseochromogenes]
MSATVGEGFDRRAAALLRAAANDLKRDDDNAERDLGLEPGSFAEYTSGRRPVDWALLQRAAEVWPLNERDLLPIHDDCPTGLSVLRAKESEASSRVLARGGTDYYEYRDTAMSRIASYRPEWIRMLQVVGNDRADNPDVRWNRGHLLYQFTYFVGPVNYYYRWQGESYCVPMETGDSVWGLPFAPHSFTARGDAEPAYILALTYGGGLVGDAQRELAVLGRRAAHELALPVTRDATSADGQIRSFMAAGCVTPAELAARTGLPPERIRQLTGPGARAVPTQDELTVLADGLGVSVRDLLPPRSTSRHGVSIQHARDARSWVHPDEGRPAYRLTRLAGDPLHPHTSALQVDVLATADADSAPLATHQHQYLFVLGDAPVRISWERDGERRTDVLGPGDSAYTEPLVPVTFSAVTEAAPRVLMLRIGGHVTPDVRHALGAMAEQGIDRYIAEDRLWYSKEGN